MKSIWLILFLIMCPGCEENLDLAPGCSSCLKNLIRKGDTVAVWRYQMEGKDVYLLIPTCCDKYIKAFDTNCKLICIPSGGFSGKGDGSCPDFNTKAIGKELIWTSE